MNKLAQLVRENIRALQPYSSARDEFAGKAGVFLDANENPVGQFNRYPDPRQVALKTTIAELKGVSEDQLFLGNGSDEVIDLLFRVFGKPGQDQVLTCSPTYGMYAVSAGINDLEVVNVPLTEDFQLDLAQLDPCLTRPQVKLLCLCSPNNPTGNSLREADLLYVLRRFKGIVLLDEAYIDFSSRPSWTSKINDFTNLVILQTLSKAWGLAGLRIGMAIANPEIVGYLNKVKPPYNISTVNQQTALAALNNRVAFRETLSLIQAEKIRMEQELRALPGVETVFPSDANFLLVRVADADQLYADLIAQQLIVRNRNKVVKNCLRISIGTPEENDRLLNALNALTNEKSTLYR